MSDTIQIKAYTYSELGETAKNKVREWLDDWQFEEWDREWWKEELEKLGYTEIDFAYSGFWSQGDGASIECSVDLESYIKRYQLGNQYSSLLYWLRKSREDCGYINGVKIKRSNTMRYVHEYMLDEDTNDLQDDLSYSVGDSHSQEYLDKLLDQVISLGESVLKEVQEKSRKLYKWLESDYEWQQTDEYLADCCEANDYLFDEYGNPVHHLEIA